jgi:DNA polymerase I-like protein with 3'-5' exonuclease and polymerase domains
MKQALILLEQYAVKWKINYKFVGNIHDEIQTEVQADQADKFGHLAVSCIEAAGLHFNLRCPLTGDYYVGSNWSQTH